MRSSVGERLQRVIDPLDRTPGIGGASAEQDTATVTNRGKVSGGPAAYAIGGEFPNSLFRREAPSAVFYAAEMARRLRAALDEQSVVQVAAAAGVGRQTIYDVIRGKTWPDMVTIIRLQDSLGIVLWPNWEPGTRHNGPVAADELPIGVDDIADDIADVMTVEIDAEG